MLSTTKRGFKSDHWPFVEFSASFRLSVRRNLGLHLFRFLLLCDWSKRNTTTSQPIRCKTETNRDLHFPALQAVGSFLLWVLIGWLLAVFTFLLIRLWSRGIWFNDTQLKCALLYGENLIQNSAVEHYIKMYISINFININVKQIFY